MKKLEEMTIEEKINTLESLLAKAKLNLEYSMQVEYGEDKEYTIHQIQFLIKSARDLFHTGKIMVLDETIRHDTYVKWSNMLDEYLSKFPEYNVKEKSRKI